MSEFLAEYLKKGLSKIVVISHEHRERRSGGQEEDTHETVVAAKGNEFVKLSVHQEARFLRDAGRYFSVTSEDKISQSEYQGLTHGKQIVDTPAALEEATKQLHREELYSKLKAMAPECPECGQKLQPKRSDYGPFWGCSRYPKCHGKSKFSPAAKKLYEDCNKS